MGGSFRKQPAPTLYPANQTKCTIDGLEIAFAVACAIIAFSFVLIIAGIRGWEVYNSYMKEGMYDIYT